MPHSLATGPYIKISHYFFLSCLPNLYFHSISRLKAPVGKQCYWSIDCTAMIVKKEKEKQSLWTSGE